MTVNVPTKKKTFDRAKDGIRNGVVGGLGVGVASAMLGPILGSIVGGAVAAAMLPEQDGKIVATNAVMDATIVFLAGGGQ